MIWKIPEETQIVSSSTSLPMTKYWINSRKNRCDIFMSLWLVMKIQPVKCLAICEVDSGVPDVISNKKKVFASVAIAELLYPKVVLTMFHCIYIAIAFLLK